MELKLTTMRALQFEERTGKDILAFIKQVATTEELSLKDAVNLFMSMGDGYTPEMFDSWDAPFQTKIAAIFEEAVRYFGGSEKKA